MYPGGEDSADEKYLTFNVNSKGIYKNQLSFVILFDYPEYVSIGERKDSLVMTIIDPNFFSS